MSLVKRLLARATLLLAAALLSTGSRAEDRLSSLCAFPVPLGHGDDYSLRFVKLRIKGKDGKRHAFNFLLDTGYAESAISPAACRRIGCKITGTRPRRTADGGAVDSVTDGATLFLARGLRFDFDEFVLEDAEALALMHADGILGGNFIFSRPVLIDFKRDRLCFLENESFASLAGIGFKRAPAEYDAGAVWVSFQLNGAPIGDYFLDSGSDATSVYPNDLRKAKLAEIGSEERTTPDGGRYVSKKYGPAVIALGALKKTVPCVVAAKGKHGLHKLGMDFLDSLVFAFDPRSRWLYVGTPE